MFMSTLIGISYPDKATAQQALATLEDLQRQALIQIADAVIATHDGEKVHLDQSVNLTGAGAIGGAFWGGLIGLIFLVPVVGAAIGAAGGALTGKLSDYGINDQFARDLASKVGPGQAALVLLTRSNAPDRVISEMKQHDFGGEIVYTNLSEANEQRLKDAVSA